MDSRLPPTASKPSLAPSARECHLAGARRGSKVRQSSIVSVALCCTDLSSEVEGSQDMHQIWAVPPGIGITLLSKSRRVAAAGSAESDCAAVGVTSIMPIP